MDATLITVTVLSMSMAAALSAIVWRMLRLERQRSNARVAALSAAAHVGQAFSPHEDDLPLAAPTVGDGHLFAAREHESPWGARLAVMAALVLVVSSFVLFSLTARARHASGAQALRPAPAAASAAASPASAANGQLELLSLHDARQSGSLTITGMVQNPRTGAPLARVAVTAYTFDEHGSFLASGRALIDVTALAPGEESPFTVTVPVTDAVARYRIGFRDDGGRVIAHVDRRQQGPIAANW